MVAYGCFMCLCFTCEGEGWRPCIAKKCVAGLIEVNTCLTAVDTYRPIRTSEHVTGKRC